MLRKICKDISESSVGSVGRTGKNDAKQFVLENPKIIKDFKRIVKEIGGKAVASQILNLNLFGKPAKIPTTYKKYKHPGEN